MTKVNEKSTQPESAAGVTVAEESTQQPEVLDLRKMYADTLKQMEQIAAMMKADGIALEVPPVETSAVQEEGSTKWIPNRPDGLRPGMAGPNNESFIPWTKYDLDPKDVYSFVPQFIPNAVHPLLDEKRRPKIFLTVNGLRCALTVGVLNEKISGMFYWAYMNIEAEYHQAEEYKLIGPSNAPWVGQGPQGSSTWHYEPEAPSAWIDLDGRYYAPGATMPGESVS